MTLRFAVFSSALVLAACSGGGAGPAPGPDSGPTAVATATPRATNSPAGGPSATPSPAPTATPAATQTPGSAATASVLVHSGTQLAPISRLVLGANMAGWYDITQSGLSGALHTAGFTATRWPGGSESDQYHWQTNSSCNGGYTSPNSTFDNFMHDVAQPAALDVAITLDYGSNAACNAGGDPSEAAAWVAHAKQQGYGVKYWTVGNEEYGSWEYDLHASQHDPATYASAVAAGYYPQVKAADANAQVGVVVEANPSWDTTVLANAKYDFVELHYYAQAPGSESDSGLLQTGASSLTSQVRTVQSELASDGHASTPIYVGELGSVYTNPGKQSTSIVQALYAGLVLGELMQDGVFRATWWLGFGGCSDATSGANFSSSLYGWQNFGGYMIVSDGTPEFGCSNATAVPRGTLLPTARAFQVMSAFARDGEHALSVTTSTALPNVRSYAASHGNGYAVVLFNLDRTSAHTVNVGVDTMASGSSATITTYGKAQYDDSQQNVWTGPVTQSAGAWQHTVPVTLPPWSMSVVVLTP